MLLVLALKNNLLQNRSERILSARLVYPRLTLLREDNIFPYNYFFYNDLMLLLEILSRHLR